MMIKLKHSFGVLVLATMASCGGDAIDTTGLKDNIIDYQDWYRITVRGDVPGHFNTYRVIYANSFARDYQGAGDYPLGSVIIKEIYDLEDQQPTDLNYIAVMRRLDEATAPAELDEGWLFTDLRDGISGKETRETTCWKKCHRQAPYRGTWFDYGAD